MSGSFRIARIAGIEIRVHVSWILIFALVTFSLASEVLPAEWSQTKLIVVAAVAALLFFASVVLHELAHSFVARRYGMSVSSITLFLLGGVANLRQEPSTPRVEALMAAAGPLTSFAIAGITYGLGRIGSTVVPSAMETLTPVADYLVTVNLVVGIFNLVPGFPLDGGRVLRAIVWAVRGDRASATTVAGRVGQVIAVGIGLVGVLIILAGDLAGLWYLLIAYFLWGMADASIEQERVLAVARGVRVGQLMTREPVTIGTDAPIDRLVNEVLLPSGLEAVPVVDAGTFRGAVGVHQLRAIPAPRWSAVTVAQIMTPAARLPTLAPDDELVSALEQLDSAPLLPVLEDGGLVGVLYPETVARYLRTQIGLGSLGAPRGSARAL